VCAPAAHLALWGGNFRVGRYAEALSEARTFYSLLGDWEIVSVLNNVADGSEYERVMTSAAEVLGARAAKAYVPAIRVARSYAHAGDAEHAIDWLEKARANQESTLLHLSVGWDWAGLRQHPRYQAMVTSVGLPL
jgi:hypothetical protein